MYQQPYVQTLSAGLWGFRAQDKIIGGGDLEYASRTPWQVVLVTSADNSRNIKLTQRWSVMRLEFLEKSLFLQMNVHTVVV